MTRKVLRTPRARKDLEDIGRYTLEHWGRRQILKYLRDLEYTIQSLCTAAESRGQDRGLILPGLRSIQHHRSHFVFYRVRDDTVEIIRVLHQRRDWATHLGP